MIVVKSIYNWVFGVDAELSIFSLDKFQFFCYYGLSSKRGDNMKMKTRVAIRCFLGGCLLGCALYFVAPLATSLLFHWNWLFRFETEHSVVLWNLVHLDAKGFEVYYKLVFAAGLPAAAIGTLLIILGCTLPERELRKRIRRP